MKIAAIVGIAVLVLLLVLVAGTRVPPRPFAPYPPLGPAPAATEGVPAGLPAPVQRFYGELYGDAVPRIGSAVVSGTAHLRLAGVPLRGRFRFTFDAGDAYRHRIDVTLFGRGALRVHERFVDGRARLELPFGVTEGEPNVDEAARLGLWAEAIWYPSTWITDPRARWTAVDDTTARLTVPHGEATHTFEVRFDPDTGLVRSLRIPRYKDAGDEARTPWLAEVHAWGEIDGHPAPVEASLTWQDDARPWVTFRTEALQLGAEQRLPPVVPQAGAAGGG